MPFFLAFLAMKRKVKHGLCLPPSVWHRNSPLKPRMPLCSPSNTWRLVSLQLCRFSIPMPEKSRFKREIVPIIQLIALLQSFLEKNESVSEARCLSLTIAFSMEPFLIALKNIHFLWKTELKAILFTCETCLCSNKIISRRWCLVNPLAELGFICTLCYRSITRHCGGMSSLLSADIFVLARRYLRPCPQISLPLPADISARGLSWPD